MNLNGQVEITVASIARFKLGELVGSLKTNFFSLKLCSSFNNFCQCSSNYKNPFFCVFFFFAFCILTHREGAIKNESCAVNAAWNRIIEPPLVPAAVPPHCEFVCPSSPVFRTTAFGFLNALCKLAAVLGISIFQSFVGITKAVPILFAAGALAAGSFLATKLPETRGQVLQ